MINLEAVSAQTGIKRGAWVKAPSFLETDADDTRSMRVIEVFEHNGRFAFTAMTATRSGDPHLTLAERTVWRYGYQVTRIVRHAPSH